MADQTSLTLLRNASNFRAALKSGMHQKLDFSETPISFDFTGMDLRGANFSKCVLAGSKFQNAVLDSCDMSGSDWADCDFTYATFNGGDLKEINNAHQARGLHLAKAAGFATGFETAVRPWWVKLDWEVLGSAGRLPIFGLSTTTLVAMPLYFYLLAVYNHHLSTAKQAVAPLITAAAPDALAAIIAKLNPIPIPSLTKLALVSALLLAIGSGIYSFLCPPLVKQFSRLQWRFQFEQSFLTYWAQAWRFPFLRMVSAMCYLFGGLGAATVLVQKLWKTFQYVF